MEIIKAVVRGIGQAHFNPDTGNYEFDFFNVHQAISGALGTRAKETEEMKYAPIEFGKWFHRNFIGLSTASQEFAPNIVPS